MTYDYKVVLIEWEDSIGVTTEWEELKDIKPQLPIACMSVGFLLDDNKDYKTIIQSYGNSQCVGRMTIPVSAIRSMKTLSISHKKKGGKRK